MTINEVLTVNPPLYRDETPPKEHDPLDFMKRPIDESISIVQDSYGNKHIIPNAIWKTIDALSAHYLRNKEKDK